MKPSTLAAPFLALALLFITAACSNLTGSATLTLSNGSLPISLTPP